MILIESGSFGRATTSVISQRNMKYDKSMSVDKLLLMQAFSHQPTNTQAAQERAKGRWVFFGP